MPLRLGVDAWNLTGDRRGIGRYAREILTRWATWPQRLQLTLLVPERLTWFARRRYRDQLNGLDLDVGFRGGNLRGLDAVWYPWNGMSWIPSQPSVVTLHDASVFSWEPQDQATRDREQRPFRVAAAHARRIITDSHFSQAELVRHLHVNPDSIDVVALGVGPPFLQPQSVAPANGTNVPYVLFVGEPERRKGLPWLLQAMQLLPSDVGRQTELRIAGASGQYPLPPLPDSIRVRNLGWMDDQALAALYAHAAVFVYPSAYEGFGLPILEAMAAGAPVIAADTRVSRETGDSAALYVPVGDASALAGALARVLTQPDAARALRLRGRIRAAALTWEATAEKTLAVIERAAREPARAFSTVNVRLFAAAQDPTAWQQALAIRYAVFVREQGVPESEEVDSHDCDDPTCVHALAAQGNLAAATGRIYESAPGEGKIGRMAVLPQFRGGGTGQVILDVLIKEGRERGLASLILDAQIHAVGFYAKRGFVAEGGTFLDAGLPHQSMRLSLP